MLLRCVRITAAAAAAAGRSAALVVRQSQMHFQQNTCPHGVVVGPLHLFRHSEQGQARVAALPPAAALGRAAAAAPAAAPTDLH